MKQKDLALIIVIVAISGIVAFFLSNLIIGSPTSKPQEVEVVEAISADFISPSEKYFNQNSKNFTQIITIGDNPNPQPFEN